MAAPQNFRSAFNGFNREDVVHYIEYLNAKHTAEVNQLTSEAEFLQSKLDDPFVSADPALLAEVQQERDDYKRQLEEAQSTIAELEARCAALEAEKPIVPAAPAVDVQPLNDRIQSLEQQLAAAIAAKNAAEDKLHQNAVQFRAEQELEAYRRAERTERLARERAEQVYRQVNGTLADATVHVDEAAAQIGEISDRVLSLLNQLQDAVSGSKQALKDAAAIMYTLRPGSTED